MGVVAKYQQTFGITVYYIGVIFILLKFQRAVSGSCTYILFSNNFTVFK